MDLYGQYIRDYNSSFAAVYYFGKKYVAFRDALQAFEAAQKQTTRLNLEALLIMPVQRVPRYILLLQVTELV
jgi:hypothetical protein